ncbi:protein geranylgeranyltransferase type I [Malassezia sp. CBS 17886]|nr:protein geranylgeranyltransferase type I [Malassezia sp. CBS 17886]
MRGGGTHPRDATPPHGDDPARMRDGAHAPFESARCASPDAPPHTPPCPVDVARHRKFWTRHVAMLPGAYAGADDQRMTLAYFCVGGLDLLGQLDAITDEQRHAYIDWVYAQQLAPSHGGGFRGAPVGDSPGHIAMTYTAILLLAMLRDDFSRLSRHGIRRFVRALQQADGSFLSAQDAAERDVRFSYCACAVAYLMDDWSMLDTDAAVRYMLSCQHYEGAFAQQPHLESHGGSTYCCVAALALAGRLHELTRRPQLEAWLLARQVPGSGFQGRLEKPQDACYSFWCGASAQILGCHAFIDAASDVRWLLAAQSPLGGIAKVPGERPDVLHSYLSWLLCLPR